MELNFDTRESQAFFAIVALVVWIAFNSVLECALKFKSLPTKVEHDVKKRLVSMTHGLFLAGMTGYIIFYDQPSYSDKNSNIQHFTVLVSMSYFIFDTLACSYYNLLDGAILLHHSLAIFGSLICEYYNMSTLAIYGAFFSELSNSSMHVRMILRLFGKKNTLVHEVFDVLYMAIYIVARGYFFSLLNFNTLFNSEIPLLLRICSLGLWLQSLVFIKMMFSILWKKIPHYQERKKKSIGYFWFSENPAIKELSYLRKTGKEAIF